MIAALLLAAGITFQPAAPTVGDPVTITFPARVTVQAGPQYEVLSNDGTHVVVRTFAPHDFEVTAIANGQPMRVRIPVKSVLQPNDALTPAPLAAPKPAPYPTMPFVLLGVLAVTAIAIWLWVFRKARRVREAPAIEVETIHDRYRAAVLALRHTRSWGKLADETRVYLAATRPRVSRDLTTTELVPRLRDEEAFVAFILRQGDMEKFSPRKPDATDFEEAARKALELAS